MFTPPPPLPGEEGLAQRRRGDTRLTTFDARGAPVVEDRPAGGPEAAGAVASERSAEPTSGAAVYSFERGEVAPVGMGPAQRLAFNAAQGDPVAIAVRDGERGPWDLNDGLEGMGGEGDLWVIFETARGPLECLLFEDLAPRTVGNFLGLARGLRPVLDRESDTWVKRRYYDGVIFHRVIPGFMIQSGDPSGTGFGSPGYVIEDEIRPQLVHDRPGLLSMANRGPGTGSAQFFITLGPTPHLDGLHTVFGECSDATLDLADDISLVPRDESDKPIEPETILEVRFERR